MALLYAVSGITVVKPDEVAVVLRWGRLVGDTPALQQHGPGLLFAFPRPMDRWCASGQARVGGAGEHARQRRRLEPSAATLDPLTQGYALTGDHNIVHVDMVARYRVRDPAEWAFYGPKAEDVLRVEVTAAMVRSLGEMGVDRVLVRRPQGPDRHGDAPRAGRPRCRPLRPRAVVAGADPARAAAGAGERLRRRAERVHRRRDQEEGGAGVRAERPSRKAQAEADAALQSARAERGGGSRRARGDAAAFLALDREYRANPAVVRERLYRDAVERAIGAAGSVRWVPPPAGGRYHGLRISIAPIEPAPRHGELRSGETPHSRGR